MSGIPIAQVDDPTHVIFYIRKGGIFGEDDDVIETYAGNVLVDFSGGGDIERKTFSTFLPTTGTSITTYGSSFRDEVQLTVAALATPLGFQAHEDEEFLCSVDSFKVGLKPQTFPGIAGSPLCLVLDFALAINNGVIIRVGYTVTAKTRFGQRGSLQLKGSTKPA